MATQFPICNNGKWSAPLPSEATLNTALVAVSTSRDGKGKGRLRVFSAVERSMGGPGDWPGWEKELDSTEARTRQSGIRILPKMRLCGKSRPFQKGITRVNAAFVVEWAVIGPSILA
jgi:hypothetical protein